MARVSGPSFVVVVRVAVDPVNELEEAVGVGTLFPVLAESHLDAEPDVRERISLRESGMGLEEWLNASAHARDGLADGCQVVARAHARGLRGAAGVVNSTRREGW